MQGPRYDTYKGHDTMTIYTGHTWNDKASGETREETVSFGVRKARAICDNIDAIRKFAAKGE